MTAPKNITLYNTQGSWWAQRVRIALIASGADFETIEIDLQAKPSWFEKVNPASKVPAITYGALKGSDGSNFPENVFRLNESAVIVDFIARLYPSIDYEDPILSAKARLLALQFEALVQTPWTTYSRTIDGSLQALLDGIISFQPFIGDLADVKEFGVGDLLVAPFIGRILPLSKHELGVWPEGSGARLLAALDTEEFKPFRKYIEKISSWSAYQKSYEEGALLARFRALYSK
ncbi:hypothetical protein BDY24DRAFT_274990 [Mrakia frigida]|uniref:glutathione S-transferase family protein n=1 Tax=Mrakia frigida TaxID=29902 RepID=UPI003FCC236D